MTDTYDRDGDDRLDAGDEGAEHDQFIESLSAPLRTAERASRAFEARVMTAVRATAAARVERRISQPAPRRVDAAPWRRPRTVALSPLGWGAMAAAFAGVVLVGEAGVRAALRPPAFDGGATRAPVPHPLASAARAGDTVYVVRFVFLDEKARNVSIVGDFNGWAKGATQLTQTARGGAWTVSVQLPPGRQEYAFVVHDASGERWVADPFANTRRDEFGIESSVVQVGRRDGYRSPSAS